MKYLIYILYQYYNKRKEKNIAYLHAIYVFLIVIFINLFTILILSDSVYILDFLLKDKSRLLQYVVFGLAYGIPGYFLINTFVKNKDLEDEKLKLKYKKIHGWYMVLYIVLSFLFFILAAKYK